MADAVLQNSPASAPPGPTAEGITDALQETLGRLSKKPGVKATLVLDRASGAILKTSGEIMQIKSSKAEAESATASQADPFSDPLPTSNDRGDGAEQLAAMVWGFVGVAGTLVSDLDVEDELKLLRLRTRKQELVIVPDPKYLLIVIHDTLSPAA